MPPSTARASAPTVVVSLLTQSSSIHRLLSRITLTESPPRTYYRSRPHLLPVRTTQPCDEQSTTRACKTQSSTASAAPADSYKSSYRKCPGDRELAFLTPLSKLFE